MPLQLSMCMYRRMKPISFVISLGARTSRYLSDHNKTTITPEQEYDRLCAKYGHEVVAKVFGEDDGDRLMEIVEGLMAEGQLPAQEKALEGTLEQERLSARNQRSQETLAEGKATASGRCLGAAAGVEVTMVCGRA
jgi:hypothetical protein